MDALPETLQPLARDFADPPAAWRPAPFWSWNDWLDGDELCRQIDAMKEAGWGGFFMHSREGLRTAYMGPDWMRLVRRCVDHARAIGLHAWLYDEDKWPSGFAGGALTRENAAARHRFLLRVRGGETPAGAGELTPLVTVGEWTYMAAEGATGVEWFNGATYGDMANPATTRAWMQLTHEPYRQAVGDAFGATCPGVFTDEPCWAHLGFGPAGALPWTAELPSEFRRRKGYDLVDALPLLFDPLPGHHAARYDFHDVMTQLFREGFTRLYGELCRAHGLVLTGHFMREDGLEDQARWIGAAMPHYRDMDWPGVDHLGRQTNQILAQKQVASAASQLGKARVLCETFGASGQGISLEDQKWITNHHIAMGINFINPHLALYSMRGARKRDHPPNLFLHQPWWHANRLLADYTARLCLAMCRGHRVAPILVLHPVATAWANVDPAAANAALEQIDHDFQSLLSDLLAAQLDFELGDELLMEEFARVEDGRLIVGGQSYDAIIVPRGTTWRRSTLTLLRAAHDAGLPIWRVGDDAWDVEGHPSEAAAALRVQIPSLAPDPAALAAVLPPHPARVLTAEGAIDPRFRLHLRQDGEQRLLFVANNHQRDTIAARVCLRGEWSLHRADPESGSISPVAATVEDGHTVLRHEFAPHASLLLLALPGKPLTPPPSPTPAVRDIAHHAGPWAIARRDLNQLLLDRCRLYTAEHPEGISLPLHQAAAEFARHAADSTPPRVEFSFAVGAEPPRDARLVIESPERLHVVLNGTEIGPSAFDGWWLDPAFRTAHVEMSIRRGGNVLVLSPRAPAGSEPLEVECPILLGDFALERRGAGFALVREPFLTPAHNLPAEGWPFHAGRLVLSATIAVTSLPAGRHRLHFDSPRATAIRATLNGTPLPTLAWAPWEIDVTGLVRRGENLLNIELSTSLFNLFGPHHSREGERMWVGPWMWADLGDWTEDYHFIPYGLGGVTILATDP